MAALWLPWLRLIVTHTPALLMLLIYIGNIYPTDGSTSIEDKCEMCQNIAQKFDKGINKTAKSNFGGGNTRWEEKSLGTYTFSETRLVEIMENLCEDTKQCHHMVEENEELIEHWWFKIYAKGLESNLTNWLCERRLKVCCPEGSYGENCTLCPGAPQHICSHNGKCSGEGTRGGTGKCQCDSGYHGDICELCMEGFYVTEKNETHIECQACHSACKTGCDGDSPADCEDCKAGWTLEEGRGCVDVDECSTESPPCSVRQYCLNKDGSHSCLSCHKTCTSCTGAGAVNCKECAQLHYKDGDTCRACHPSCANKCLDGTAKSCDSCGAGWTEDVLNGCVDVDECVTETCDEGQVCVNTQGSYSCQDCDVSCAACSGMDHTDCITCAPGYHMTEDHTCQDIDECETRAECQEEHEVCHNVPGSYQCQCSPGYKRTNKRCVKEQKRASSKKPKSSSGTCKTCQDIVDNFRKGLKNTENLNFGGGNTQWEEQKIGAYSTSETRFVEIIEGLCDSDKDCHTMVERYESYLEQWWSQSIKHKTSDAPLLQYFCVDQIQICCPNGTYGPDCKPCTAGSTNPCSGNGKCDGDGTRKGTGKCRCDNGYHGDSCDECTDGFYETSVLETKVECVACHVSCESTCWEGGPKGCDECKAGWTRVEDVGCEDVDECESDVDPCEDNKYCVNKEGTYICEPCHNACSRCTGPGLEKCTECDDGYEMISDICSDMDECTAGGVCSGDHERCVNTRGSFSCFCTLGYQRNHEHVCVETSPEDEPTTEGDVSPPAPSEEITNDPKDEL